MGAKKSQGSSPFAGRINTTNRAPAKVAQRVLWEKGDAGEKENSLSKLKLFQNAPCGEVVRTKGLEAKEGLIKSPLKVKIWPKNSVSRPFFNI